jgi:hypothetical protein
MFLDTDLCPKLKTTFQVFFSLLQYLSHQFDFEKKVHVHCWAVFMSLMIKYKSTTIISQTLHESI